MFSSSFHFDHMVLSNHDRVCFAYVFLLQFSLFKCSLGLTSMLRKLWVSQDLFAEFQAISVLLVLVTSLQRQRKQIIHVTSEVDGLSSSTSAQLFRQTREVHRRADFTSATCTMLHWPQVIIWKCQIAALRNMDNAHALVMKGC